MPLHWCQPEFSSHPRYHAGRNLSVTIGPMEPRKTERERYWREREMLAQHHQFILRQERLERRKPKAPAAKLDWKKEKREFRNGFKRHLKDFAREFGRAILKALSLR